MSRRTRAVLLSLGLSFGLQAHAIKLNLQPEGDNLTRAVETALLEVAPKGSGLKLELDTGRGPRMVWGAAETGVPFNPDVAVRVSGRGSNRLIELNPSGPLTRAEAVRAALATEFELSEWTPAAARLRFSGADLNADGAMNLTDLALMMEALGSAGTGGKGDLNGDRQIDRADLEIFSAAYTVGPLPTLTLEQPEAAESKQAKAAPAEQPPSSAAQDGGTTNNQIKNATGTPPLDGGNAKPEGGGAPKSP